MDFVVGAFAFVEACEHGCKVCAIYRVVRPLSKKPHVPASRIHVRLAREPGLPKLTKGMPLPEAEPRSFGRELGSHLKTGQRLIEFELVIVSKAQLGVGHRMRADFQGSSEPGFRVVQATSAQLDRSEGELGRRGAAVELFRLFHIHFGRIEITQHHHRITSTGVVASPVTGP